MDLQLLPDTVWQQVQAILLTAVEQCNQPGTTLTDTEQILQAGYQQVHRVLVAQIAHQQDEAHQPVECACGGHWHSEGRRERDLVTTLGEVRFGRRTYVCTQCKARTTPLDDAWQIRPGALSPLASQRATGLCTSLPFREAHRWFTEGFGVQVCQMTLWRATQKAGAVLLEQETQKLEATGQWKGAIEHAQALQGLGAPGRFCLAADGVLIRVDGNWTEAKVGTVGPLTWDGRWRPGGQSYTASLREAQPFRHQLVHHALERGVTRRTSLAFLSDGAPWTIPIGQRFYPQAVMIRDWWHGVEYLWQAGKALYGQASPQTRAFVAAMKGILWKGNVEEVMERLVAAADKKPIRGQQGQKDFGDAVRYLDNQKQWMRYDEYREAHWPIGSGPVEAACKTVVAARMKRSGMDWSRPGASHMLCLRSAYYTHQCSPSFLQN